MKLDAIENIWNNLEKAYAEKNKGKSRYQFLRMLLNAEGDAEPNKCAVLKILDEEVKTYDISQMTRYTALNDKLTYATINLLNCKDEVIEDLDVFVSSKIESIEDLNMFCAPRKSGRELIRKGRFSSWATLKESEALDPGDQDLIAIPNKCTLVAKLHALNPEFDSTFKYKALYLALRFFQEQKSIENLSLVNGDIFTKDTKQKTLSLDGYKIKYSKEEIHSKELQIPAPINKVVSVEYIKKQISTDSPQVVILL